MSNEIDFYCLVFLSVISFTLQLFYSMMVHWEWSFHSNLMQMKIILYRNAHFLSDHRY